MVRGEHAPYVAANGPRRSVDAVVDTSSQSDCPPASPLRAAPRAAGRQFGLADVMAYLLAGSVYMAMVVSLEPLVEGRAAGQPEPSQWPGVISTAIAWGVLWFLYRRWRLRPALLVHCAGPLAAAMTIAMALVVGFFEWGDTPGEFRARVFAILLASCSLSALVSFPVATLLLVCRGLRPK
jgi:hypothetical protein